MRRFVLLLAVVAAGALPGHAAEGPSCRDVAPIDYTCQVTFTAERELLLLFASGPETVVVSAHLEDQSGDEQRVVCWTETCVWTLVAPDAFQAGEEMTLTGHAAGSGAWLVQAIYR